MNTREIIGYVKEASHYKNPALQFFDVISHKMKMNTSPLDYYRFQFYKNSLTDREKERFVGKRGSCFYPWQANKVQYTPLFDNKYIFKTMISGLGLPQPELMTAIGADYEIKTIKQFEEFLSENRRPIVLKPLDGSGGQGVVVVLYKKEKPLNSDSAADLWHKIQDGRVPYLAEEWVDQLDELSVIHPWSLNTLRIMTIKGNDQKWYLLGTWLRTGQNKTHVDNLGSGGISIRIDAAGRAAEAIDWRSQREIQRHPETGAKLTGIEIPGYSRAVELALTASRKFGFMGTIGWDIGLSKKGPVIIEANIFYDVFYWQHGRQGPFIPSHLTSKLKRRRWWHSWDKTALYPKADRGRIRS